MAAVKSRSVATGVLALAGLLAAGVAILGKSPDQAPSADGAAPDSLPPEVALGASSASETNPDRTAVDVVEGKPAENQNLDRRGSAMNGSAQEIEAARKSNRSGNFGTVLPPEVKMGLNGSRIGPKLALESGARMGSPNAAPIEFIVKLKDRGLTDTLRNEFEKSPDDASRHLKSLMGGGKIVQRGRLQGFTMGGEAILKFDGPGDIDDFAKAHDEIQRALSAAPGVSYAEQNYTADINSAQ